MPELRKFNGKIYKRAVEEELKSDAKKKAKILRDGGDLVRVIKSNRGWEVYRKRYHR